MCYYIDVKRINTVTLAVSIHLYMLCFERYHASFFAHAIEFSTGVMFLGEHSASTEKLSLLT